MRQATAGSSRAASPPWFLRHRSTIPERSPGFFRRHDLANRCAPTASHLTLLVAPGGFGKTTLLAECCHDALEAGTRVAWLTLDDENAEALDLYLAHAFQQAGLDVLEQPRSGEPFTAHTHPRTNLLLAEVEARGDPFVLALDEAERLSDSATALVNHLLRAAPPCLHVAIAARQLPSMLDVAPRNLAGDSVILTAEDLRFSRDDIDQFFDHELSRRQLAKMASESAGWPIALRIRRYEHQPRSDPHAHVLEDVIGNWMESRFWCTYTEPDAEFLLDVGLFDWFDSTLLETVLEDRHALPRLQAMRTLDGLLKPVRGAASLVWELHPLIRDHCSRHRRRHSRARYHAVHSRIAGALAARGRTVDAMRHASEADDQELVARILVDAGGIRLRWREGLDQLVAADRLVDNDALTRHARLVPARSVALAVAGRVREARSLLASLPEEVPPTDDRHAIDLYLDRWLARSLVARFGVESAHADETPAAVANFLRLATLPPADPVILIAGEFLLCTLANSRANFDEAVERGQRVRQSSAPSLAAAVEIQFGLVAMAEGRAEDAASLYRRAQRLARARFQDTCIPMLTNLHIRELQLERNRVEHGTTLPTLATIQSGATADAYFAACDIATELTLDAAGSEAAIASTDRMLAHARHVGLPALARHLAAMRVSLLADANRVEEAEHSWADARLPDTDAKCVDLDNQSWRELESLCCARLRLLSALGRVRTGRRLARTVLQVATVRRLRRTEMRVRVVCMKLEDRIGSAAAAFQHLVAFLDLFADTDYARPLVREGDVAVSMLHRFLNADTPSSTGQNDAAARLLAAAGERHVGTVPHLTDREFEVLARLQNLRDDDIATALGISRHGVRYHVGNILKKLKSPNRRGAVQRARALGLISPVD